MREVPPLIKHGPELGSPFFGNVVIPAALSGRGDFPHALYKAVAFKSMQGRVESAFLEPEVAAALTFHLLGEPVSIHVLSIEEREQEGIGASF